MGRRIKTVGPSGPWRAAILAREQPGIPTQLVQDDRLGHAKAEAQGTREASPKTQSEGRVAGETKDDAEASSQAASADLSKTNSRAARLGTR